MRRLFRYRQRFVLIAVAVATVVVVAWTSSLLRSGGDRREHNDLRSIDALVESTDKYQGLGSAVPAAGVMQDDWQAIASPIPVEAGNGGVERVDAAEAIDDQDASIQGEFEFAPIPQPTADMKSTGRQVYQPQNDDLSMTAAEPGLRLDSQRLPPWEGSRAQETDKTIPTEPPEASTSTPRSTGSLWMDVDSFPLPHVAGQTAPSATVSSSPETNRLPARMANAAHVAGQAPAGTGPAPVGPVAETEPGSLDELSSVVSIPVESSAEMPDARVVGATEFDLNLESAANGSSTTSEAAAPGSTPSMSKEKSPPHILIGSDNYKLAAEPKLGEHYRDDRPITDPAAHQVGPLVNDFSPGPNYDYLPYQSGDQRQVYEGKQLNAVQRPLVELGRPWYQLGQLSPGVNWFGKHNNIAPQFLIYGDYRTAIASNSAAGDNRSLLASELNLDLDLKLTGTERFHAFMSPLDNGVTNTGYLLDDDEFVDQFDANFDFGYFEGDLGAIVGGMVDETMPFDFPFAIGVMPLLFQNGVWMEDAFLGVAATIPARNSARLNISNMDVTFFAGYDKITSGAFPGDDSASRIYGVASFIEALNGYFEIDYAFLDDRTFNNRSYHNIGLAYSRRFGRLLSNSTRVIINAGQASNVVPNTADGVLLLSENSLITGAPSTLVPYFNLFAGFDRPQSAARAVQAGGVLRNTGILFESDGMTNYPTLDPTANDTYGAALGLNLIASDFSQQLVLEMAMLGVMGDDATRNAPGQQMGLGFRYQLPLSNSLILRADGMYGFLDNQADVRGIRMELRRKW